MHLIGITRPTAAVAPAPGHSDGLGGDVSSYDERSHVKSNTQAVAGSAAGSRATLAGGGGRTGLVSS